MPSRIQSNQKKTSFPFHLYHWPEHWLESQISREITIKNWIPVYAVPKHLVSLVKKYVNPDVWHCIDKTSRWLADLTNKLLKWTRCSGFFGLQGLGVLGDTRRKQMSPLELHHLHAFLGHWSGCVKAGFKLKNVNDRLRKIKWKVQEGQNVIFI